MTDLFPSRRRVCVVCEADVPGRDPARMKPGQVPMLGLYVTIYRRSAKGRQLAGSGRILVCESCLMRIAAEGSTHRIAGRRLADAILAAVAKRVAAMCDEEPRRRQSAPSPKEPAA